LREVHDITLQWRPGKGLKECFLQFVFHETRGKKVNKKKERLEPAIVIVANATASLDFREQHLVVAPPK
jgi:hypothetical protein